MACCEWHRRGLAALETDRPRSRQRSPHRLEAVGIRLIELAGPDMTWDNRVVDTDGIYGRLLDSLNADAALIRLDFVLFGCAPRANVVDLANELLERLHSTANSRNPHQMAVA
jgi:hypothetical protein